MGRKPYLDRLQHESNRERWMLIPLTPRWVDLVSSLLDPTLGMENYAMGDLHRSKSFELPVSLWHYIMQQFQYVSLVLDP